MILPIGQGGTVHGIDCPPDCECRKPKTRYRNECQAAAAQFAERLSAIGVAAPWQTAENTLCVGVSYKVNGEMRIVYFPMEIDDAAQ